MWHEGIRRPLNTIIRKCIDINGAHLRQSILINIWKWFGQYDDLLEPQFDLVIQCRFNFDIILNKQKRNGPFGKAASFAFYKRC